MNIVGRYHRVRRMGASGISAPYIWDRGRAQESPRLLPGPYSKDDPEWVQLPSGVLVPAIRGGAGGTYVSGFAEYPRSYIARASFILSQQTLALDSNYVNATGGDAIAARFIPRVTGVLSKIYFFVFSYTGTAANVNDLDCEFRNNSDTTGPGSTLHDSVTVDPASTTGWRSGTWGTGFTLVADTAYWAIVGDADGSGVDFATLMRNVNNFSSTDATPYTAVSTTDGWTATRTFSALPSGIVLLLTNGKTYGNPISASATSTNGTNQRGLRFIAPTTATVYGMITHSAAAGLTGINLWEGSSGPSGSPFASGTAPIAENAIASATERGYAFGTSPTISQGTTYRLVFTYGANAAVPHKWQIGTGSDATLLSAMLGGGSWYWAEASGTTDWSNDNTAEFPAVDVVLDDFVTLADRGQLLNRGWML